MEPLVSVIVPVYNVLPYLREALDSVINQTYKNLEILVVDDGSTDGSGEVCDEYLSDPRVIVIHQENKGLSGARNTALARMTGEYVAFLDSDDAFMPEMIEKMMNAIIRNEAGIAICKYAICSTTKHLSIRKATIDPLLFSSEKVMLSSNAINMMIHGHTGWYVWNKLYHCSVWKNIRFPEESNFEDMQVMCPILKNGQMIVTVPEPLILYRKRPGSITATFSYKNILDHIHAIQVVEEYAKNHSPAVISPDSVRFLREFFARFLSVQYAHMIFRPCSHNIRKLIRKEALIRWKLLEKDTCKLNSKVINLLFTYTPGLILPAKWCWQFSERFLTRINRP